MHHTLSLTMLYYSLAINAPACGWDGSVNCIVRIYFFSLVQCLFWDNPILGAMSINSFPRDEYEWIPRVLMSFFANGGNDKRRWVAYTGLKRVVSYVYM